MLTIRDMTLEEVFTRLYDKLKVGYGIERVSQSYLTTQTENPMPSDYPCHFWEDKENLYHVEIKEGQKFYEIIIHTPNSGRDNLEGYENDHWWQKYCDWATNHEWEIKIGNIKDTPLPE